MHTLKPRHSTTAEWLAWRELHARKGRLALSVALVALATGLCVGTELLSRARELAISQTIDAIGPTLQVIPGDMTQTDLQRLTMGKSVFAETLERDILTQFSQMLRTVEGRLIIRLPVDSLELPVIGTANLNTVVLGIQAAKRLSKSTGDPIWINGTEFPISAVLPSTGSSEDGAVFVPRQSLQTLSGLTRAVNELRVFSLPGANTHVLAASLSANYSNLKIIRNDRGTVADRDTDSALKKHRFILYSVTALMVALSLFTGALLNLRERTGELATLVAIGATRTTVFRICMTRALIVSVFGTMLGYLLGLSLALGRGVEARFILTGAHDLLAWALLGSAGLSLLAVGPVLLVLGRRWNGFES